MKNLTENGIFEIDDNLYTKEDLLNLYRLQKQLLIEENIVASLEDCANIWANYSADLMAGWLFFPKEDKDILIYIKSQHQFTNFTEYAK